MAVLDVAHADFADKVLAASSPVMVCFTARHFFPKMRGMRACERFRWTLVDAAHLAAGKFLVAEVDFSGRWPVGHEVFGVSMWKPLPQLVLFRHGKEVARRHVGLSYAKDPRTPRRLVEWAEAALGTTNAAGGGPHSGEESRPDRADPTPPKEDQD